eukprot:365474-Chlamydomonas_euryale.AAC.4
MFAGWECVASGQIPRVTWSNAQAAAAGAGRLGGAAAALAGAVQNARAAAPELSWPAPEPQRQS